MKSEKKHGIGIALGAAIGVALGTVIILVTNNLKIGIGVGTILGIAIGVIFKLKRYPKLKWTLISITSLLVIFVVFGIWFLSLLPREEMRKRVRVSETGSFENLSYLSKNVIPKRGKILAIVTSSNTMGSSRKSTGYELTELSRAYYVFEANGFEVDIASPLGGEPPVVIDDDDMGKFDYAFLKDSIAQYKTSHTIAMNDVVPDDYEAVFFVGGKGAMFDFPNNKAIQSLIRNYYQSDKVVGAVCHDPAALVNVTLDNGRPLIENKKISSFTNKEELLLIPDAKTIFPFLLQDKLTAQGAQFNEGGMYLEKISHDKNLVTGQNPWSTWLLAETMIKQLGYTPKYRRITAEENAVKVLQVYESQGAEKAKALIKSMASQENMPMARDFIVSHSIIAAMEVRMGHFFGLLGLISYAKKVSKN
ncbi:type 1 glutamine amidotransferase domain-containing protein [Tenacibaculum retecalamus]|uniref:type 1 glutamine amidotransferase domain-containing protein n=1 Tax=Tenacibaculum retecalamus TaxID=3018315 RepID=UPI0023D9284D|nr:type 1 glutamine amidotransferase domain-containing protein [Tenacibaculum retecalamus]WBX71054.1 type 1 glutamine amidotransferase domain-containing protein [Tenacibaculum retecalamus]